MKCENCNGTGVVTGGGTPCGPKPCPVCGGTGKT